MLRSAGLTQAQVAKRLGHSRSWLNEKLAQADEGLLLLSTVQDITRVCNAVLTVEVSPDGQLTANIATQQ
jgi:transcriptional regulator with XRE-family HTH domain